MSTQPVLRDLLLEGERVRLRPLDVSDVDVAFGMLAGKREILDWLEWSGPTERDDLLPVYAHWRAGSKEGCNYYFAIVDLADDAFSGCIAARFRGHPGLGDLGFWIDVEKWGRGLGSEAVALTARLCFEHLETTLLSACAFVGNHASRRLLEKAGFREEHCSRTTIDAKVREQWHFSLTRSAFASLADVLSPRVEQVALERDEGPRADG